MVQKILFLALFVNISLFGYEESLLDKAVNKVKKVVTRGQDIAVDKTLINGMNAVLDKKHIEIKYLKKDPKTKALTTIIYLNGEKKYLNITLKDFKWGYSKDEEHIILEKLNLYVNIPWIEYLLKDSIRRDNGYIILPNYLSISSFLETIKPATKTTFKPFKKKPLNPLTYPFNPNFVDIKTFKVDKKTLSCETILDKKETLKFEITHFDLFSANNKKYTIFRNIKFKSINKPWVQSIIAKWGNSLKIDYDTNFHNTLASGKYEYQKKKELQKVVKKGKGKK